ncbi:MAG: hypothetical protein GY803_31425 [Chloroflexi bacterium]|nr:hypothetical protein [Chloroflexota bacterium]
MKRIILLVVAALMLVGCGLDEAAQGATASMGASSEGIEITQVVFERILIVL